MVKGNKAGPADKSPRKKSVKVPAKKVAGGRIPIVHPDLSFQNVLAASRGRGIIVGIVDSGIDANHPDLKGKVIRACEVSKEVDGTIVCREVEPEKSIDHYGHGTGVAGVIAKVAPEAKFINVKVLDEYNSCTGDVLIEGARWVLQQEVKVVNMSLATSKEVWFPMLQELCEDAYTRDKIIVASRRNFGDYGAPSMFSSVISVDRDTYPEVFRVHYRKSHMIEVVAHGTDIETPAPGGGHVVQTGTSFATPHVAGFVALLLEMIPDLIAVEAKTILKSWSCD